MRAPISDYALLGDCQGSALVSRHGSVDHLVGYAGSTPVRVGNDASAQKQLDVLRAVLECAWVLRDQLDDLPPALGGLLRSLADRAATTWEEPDAGIWGRPGGGTALRGVEGGALGGAGPRRKAR